MNNKTNKFLFVALICSITFTNSSCFFNNYFKRVEPFHSLALCQKGSGSLSLCNHFDESNLHFRDDEQAFEEAFKGTNQAGDYSFIVYDTVKGLDLSIKNGSNYLYAGTLSRGNYQLLPLHEGAKDKTDNIKIFANNEEGSLGFTLKAMYLNDAHFELSFCDLNDREYYDYLFAGNHLSEGYDYAFVAEPYATHLATQKDSPLYDAKYDKYTGEDSSSVTAPRYLYKDLHNLYKAKNDSPYNDRGIPQNGIFINKDYYASHQEEMDNILSLIDIQMYNKFVIDAQYTRLDFFDLSKDYNDPNEDENSEQTKKALKYQFDTVGINYDDIRRLQFWDPILGEDAPFEKFPNRLRYSKTLQNYYTREYFINYYSFIGKEYPGDQMFMHIKLN